MWSLVGDYNLSNALAAAAAAFDCGVSFEAILTGLSTFTGVAKRMQCVVENDNIKVHQDFAPSYCNRKCNCSGSLATRNAAYYSDAGVWFSNHATTC